LIGLVGAHGDAFELLELAEEVLDEMAPLVHLLVDGERLCAARMLGDDGLGAACVEFGDNGVVVESLVADQRFKIETGNQRLDANAVVALAGEKDEANEIAEGVDQGHDFGG